MPRMKVDGDKDNPRPYFPKELVDEGFVGDLLILSDAMTATIIHPKADLEQVKKSLQIILQDIDLRIAREKRKPEETNKPDPSDESQAC